MWERAALSKRHGATSIFTLQLYMALQAPAPTDALARVARALGRFAGSRLISGFRVQLGQSLEPDKPRAAGCSWTPWALIPGH